MIYSVESTNSVNTWLTPIVYFDENYKQIDIVNCKLNDRDVLVDFSLKRLFFASIEVGFLKGRVVIPTLIRLVHEKE